MQVPRVQPMLDPGLLLLRPPGATVTHPYSLGTHRGRIGAAAVGLALSYFVRMVRKLEIDAAGVKVQLWPKK